MEEMMLPALIRGWIISNSDLHGHVWYSPTPEGMAMLEAERRKPDPPDAPPAPPAPFDDEAADYYLERFTETAARFDAAAPQCEREIGDIPLPVSIRQYPATGQGHAEKSWN